MTNNQEQNVRIFIFKAELSKFAVIFVLILSGAVTHAINTGLWLDSLKLCTLLSFASMIYTYTSYLQALRCTSSMHSQN